MSENKSASRQSGVRASGIVRSVTVSGLLLAVGLVLPFLTGQLKNIGSMLLPMHIPVLLCGLICGWRYGAAAGFILPLFRNLLFSMPPMPGAISMAFEMGVYGLVAGAVYPASRWKCVVSVYKSLIAAMLAGRLVWGAAQYLILGIRGEGFTLEAFLAGAFLNAIPGIILQLIFIPILMLALGKTGAVRLQKREDHALCSRSESK